MVKVTLDVGRLKTMAAGAAERGVRAALGEGETRLKDDLLNRAGTGREYRNGGLTRRASAPGEPPAPDTGALRQQTNADPDLRRDGDDVSGSIVSNVAYAEALERGTERMAARPFLSTLATDHAEALNEAFLRGAKE